MSEKILIKEGIINPKMLLDLGFYRKDENLDEVYCHNELEVKNMRLHDLGGYYSFVVIGTIQGIGKMVTFDQLIDGFEFVTGGELLK